MSEQQSHTTKIIAGILIGVVVIGFGIFGTGKLIQYLTTPENSDDTENKTTGDENDAEEIQIFFEYNKTLQITDIEGNITSLGLERDQFVIFYFFSLGCVPCQAFSPNLHEATKEYVAAGEMIVISVSTHPLDHESEIQSWADDGEYNWTLVREGYGSQYSSPFGIQYTPTTVYIGPNNIMRTNIGNESTETIQANIESIGSYNATESKSACKIYE